jgi:uncharacterized protein (DUF885 family)
MRRIALLFLCVAGSIHINAQTTTPMDTTLVRLLKSIDVFQQGEAKLDSIAGHPLGNHYEADLRRRYNFYIGVYAELYGIEPRTYADSINTELLKYDVKEELSYWEYKMYLNPILADEGFHTGLAQMGNEHPATKKDFDRYIGRLKDMPRYVEEQLDYMQQGLAMGISQPKAILAGFDNTYTRHIVSDYTKSVFFKPFLTKPVSISESEWPATRAAGQAAVEQYAIPAYKSIQSFFDKEYLVKARTTIGVSNYPNGLDFYQDRVKHYTSTDLSYESIYQLGLDEVARIKKEMLEVLSTINFKGSLPDFINWLRQAPQFYATTAEQLLKEASYIAKKADGMLPAFFGKLPRQPYGVDPVPEHLAPTYTAGRYAGASIYGKNAAHYWVNTYDLKSRPFYNLEALTMHEAVPGHHLQLSLAQELSELHPFRRNIYVNAFGEGWGLYAEWLGTEMGFYKDPYSHFGKLTYEMWRACRLVIDVGLHTKGWTREQAVKYLSDNTALSLHEVNTEINRYISWPGQALAYKIGELKIRELRKKAEAALKEKFDIREFHDLVLSQGSVTMKILERMVERYIEGKKQD